MISFPSIFRSPFAKSCFAGIFLALSFPPFGVLPALIPAFFLLFQLAEESDSGKQLAYWSYPAFVLWNLISTYWLMFATVAGGAAAILANAVLMTIPLAFMRRFLTLSLNFQLKSLLIAASWTSYEFLHFRWDLAWPWLSVGNAFANFPYMIQFIELTGQLGITFFTLFLITIAYFIFKNWSLFSSLNLSFFKRYVGLKTELTDGSQIPLPGYIVLIVLCLATINVVLYTRSVHVPVTTAEVAVIQPNYDSYLPDAGFSSMPEAMHNLLQLADSARSDNTALILFPENSIQPLIHTYHYFSRQLSDSAQKWNTTLVAGLSEYVLYTNDKPSVYRGTNNDIPYDIFNSSLIWEWTGIIQPYRKHNLVPIVERMPFVDELALLDVFNWINWGSFSGFAQGNSWVNARFKGGSSSILICYDSVFPDWSRQYVLGGATLIGIITNDGWWGDTPGHGQHFSFGRLRAIEARRSIARSANNGISGFISPEGEILEQSSYWTRTFLKRELALRTDITLYVRYGDWIGWFSLLFCLVYFGISRFRKTTHTPIV